MAKDKTTPARRGGWRHPGAIALAVIGLAWAIGYLFYINTWNFPGVGRIDVIADLGHWNWAIAGAIGLAALIIASSTAPPPAPNATLGWRYAAHLMVGSGVIGLLWIVTFYTTSNTDVNLPVFTALGNWNLVVGMSFIVAAFGFATKWE